MAVAAVFAMVAVVAVAISNPLFVIHEDEAVLRRIAALEQTLVEGMDVEVARTALEQARPEVISWSPWSDAAGHGAFYANWPSVRTGLLSTQSVFIRVEVAAGRVSRVAFQRVWDGP